MSSDVPGQAKDCVASTGAAVIQLAELVRREWPRKAGRILDEAVKAHVASLLEQVAALPRDQHVEGIAGIIATLLQACVAGQEEALLRSTLGRQGL